jgi:hypothetical protein
MNPTNTLNDYQVKKQLRLQEIATAYFPSPPEGYFKKLFNNQPLYTPCENYATLQPPDVIPLQVNYSKRSNYITIALAFVFGAWPHLIKKGNSDADDVFGSIVVISIMAGMALKQLLYRKPLLVVSGQGLLFTKDNLEIKWEYVIAAHIAEEKGGDSTDHFLVTDYYDAHYGYCKVHRFKADCYDTNYPAIAAAIAYCQQKANAAKR